MQKNKNILICPLEWGLGHAGRMVPVARKIMAMGNKVYIGSGNIHLEFFRKELPGLSFINFPGFKIKYSRWLPQYIVIFLKIPLFIADSIIEHRRLKKIICDYDIDIVISDSRIGLWNRNIITVLITHLMRIPYPKGLRFLENAGAPFVRMVTGKFTRCFIPDAPGEINLSGKLSHNLDLPSNARYIGLLSKFVLTEAEKVPVQKKYFCTVILSGPEPQKRILKEKMTAILENCSGTSVILEGEPGDEIRRYSRGNVTFISHLPSPEFKHLILESETLVSRSGYTTLMELVSLHRSALIIPTPGQTEQEYLAEFLSQKGWFKAVGQNDLSLNTDLLEIKAGLPWQIIKESENLLAEALSELIG